MQTIWKGTVSFGLVSIPVRLYAATEERDVSFRQVHRGDGGRIRYRRICEIEGEEVPYGEITKAYEMPDGEMVVLEKDDFDTLPLPSSRVIDVLQFIPTDQLDPLMIAKSYYLSADGPGAKPYVLLRDALASTDRIAIVKVALRNREQLAAVRARDDVMVLQTMLWPDEVRDTGAVAPDADVTVREQEVAMAESYIDTLTADFDPGQYTDDYRHALEELIEAKAEGVTLEEAAAPKQDANVVDLMAALRASVDAAKARRGEAPSADSGSGAADPAAAGRSAAPVKKAPTKKSPAVKATAVKATPAKTPPGKAARTGAAAAKKTAAKKAPAAARTADTAAKTATRRTAKSA